MTRSTLETERADCNPLPAAALMKTRLRVLRAEHEWSQAELAHQVGVSRQTICAIETGKYSPSLHLAFRIARAFHRLIEDIFLYDPNGTQLPRRRVRTHMDSHA
jgi:putative transcriptional regulator